MARAVVKIRRIKVTNKFPRLLRASYAAMNPKASIVYQTTRFAARKIKTLQRKAPKKPRIFTDTEKTLYGYRATYKPGSKRFQQGKRRYQRKGLYSKPGSPPFWHKKSDNPFNTMRIVGEFDKKGYAAAWSGVFRKGGKVADQKIVGPAVRKNKAGSVSVPELHEFGGTRKIGRNVLSYRARNGARIMRKERGIAKYPARPFVRPGARAGSLEAWAKYGKKKFTRIGGMKPKKVVKMRRAG